MDQEQNVSNYLAICARGKTLDYFKKKFSHLWIIKYENNQVS